MFYLTTHSTHFIYGELFKSYILEATVRCIILPKTINNLYLVYQPHYSSVNLRSYEVYYW